MSRVATCLVALFLVASPTSAGQIAGGFIQGGLNSQPPGNAQPVTGRSTIRAGSLPPMADSHCVERRSESPRSSCEACEPR